ncbi:MAG: hypothetical protein LBQ81_10640 [Zoogloeaceae bacterium]|jgi:hypothetical protein|nr:hypothetical protein [Zoogloeaceae bacterium]
MNRIHHLLQPRFYTPPPVLPATMRDATDDAPTSAPDTANTADGAPSSIVQISMESWRLMRQEAQPPAKEANEALELYGKYEHRLNPFMRQFFTRDDKELLGKAYALADRKNFNLEKIDKLARELGLVRIRQYMAGELVLVAVDQEQDENAPRQVDLAHLAILGEMKKMAG